MIVSVVLPCYNPPPGWEQTICAAYKSFSDSIDAPVELIIVLDGVCPGITTDDERLLNSVVPKLNIVKYPVNRGKGYAIRKGVSEAKGDIIIYTDVDFPYTSESILAVYQSLRYDGTDVAVGVKNDAYYDHVPLVRRVISRILRFLIRLFLAMPITDTQCGLKGFKRSVSPLFLQTTIDRYLFDLEFVRNCFRSKKFAVKAIPIALNEHVHFRKMNYRILFTESVNFIRLLFRKQ